jgi:hypothetical protein
MVNLGPYKIDVAPEFVIEVGSTKMYPFPKLGLIGSLGVDVALAVFFFVPHSIFCRPPIKQKLGDSPDSLYRSMYVLHSSIAVQLIIHWWQPVWVDIVLWDFWSKTPWSITAYVLAFLWFFSAFVVIDHFEFLGVKQSTGVDIMDKLGIAPHSSSASFYGQPRLHYKLCRHPVQFGFLCLFFSVPTMTCNHLFFSATCALYIFVTILGLQEPELVEEFAGYKQYQEEMPAFCPLGCVFRGKSSQGQTTLIRSAAE